MSQDPTIDAVLSATAPPPRDRARIAVTSVAIGLRAIAALTLSGTPVGLHDPLLYQRFAQGIANGDGYVSFNGELTSYYPPGYPFFLGSLQWVCDRLGIPDRLPIVAGLAQALLGGLAVWAIIGVGDRLRPGDGPVRPPLARLGIIAGALLAVWPNLVLHSTVLLSETLFIAVFSWFLLAMMRAVDNVRSQRRDLFSPAVLSLLGAGLVLGLAALVRPQVLVVLVAVVVLAVSIDRPWQQRVAVLVLPIVGMVFVVAPWTIRNATVFHEFVAVSTNGGDNLCVGFHPGATGHFEIPPFCDTGEFYIDGPAAELRRDHETSARARTWATHNIGALPMLSLRKLYYTYEHDHDALRAVESYEEDRFLPGAVRGGLRWLSDGYYLIVMVATVAGAATVATQWWGDRRRGAGWAFVWVATLVSALVPMLVFGETRFKVPATPGFVLLAAAAVLVLLGRNRSRPEVVVEPEHATVPHEVV